MIERPIASIRIGTRHRKDVGDVRSLAASIEDVGLLHPPVIKSDGELVAGARRLRACQLLGWTTIPVRVLDVENIVRAEAAENFERQDFTPSEAVAIKRTLEPEMKAEAERRMKAGQPSDNFSKGRAADKASAFTGYSRFTLDKAEAVVAAAEAEPERFGKLVEQMDKTGKVDAAHKMLKVARARDDYQARREQGGRVSDLVALAASGYRAACIVADPPWRFEPWSRETGMDRAADNHYKTMTVDEIKAFGAQYVLPLAADNCMLLMWATWPLMPNWIPVLSAWGCTYTTCGFLLAKQNESGVGWHIGNGYHTRSNTEPCLLATRGAPLRLSNDVEQLIVAPVRAHSEKPDEVYARIERLVAGPYLELFARKTRPGWTVWGDEVPPPVVEPTTAESERDGAWGDMWSKPFARPELIGDGR